MIKTVFIFSIFLSSNVVLSWNCRHTNLSNQFDLLVEKKLTKTEDGNADSTYVKISVLEKRSEKIIQIIRFTGEYLFNNQLVNCNDVRSYSTHINDSSIPADNLFGDVVVADLNFDGMDDFAVVHDYGGNGGPIYNFYIQKNDKTFVRDKFLSETVQRFPSVINKDTETFVVRVRANTYQYNERKCEFNKEKSVWKIIYTRLVDT